MEHDKAFKRVKEELTVYTDAEKKRNKEESDNCKQLREKENEVMSLKA